MAAPPPPTGTDPPDPMISPRARKKSFADIVSGPPSAVSIGIKEPRTYCGKPAVVFSKKEADLLADRYRFSLVGKFSHGKPSMEIIRRTFASFGLKGAYHVGLIDAKHVLITITLEEDFIRLWMKPVWFIDGCPMRLFKWSKTFHPHRESPLVPCWITFPYLPVYLFYKSALWSIANLIGKPLKIDDPTSNVTRPSLARVCVELDVSKPLVDSVWVAEHDESAGDGEGYTGFWQEVRYEKPPSYCSFCYHVGHHEADCMQKGPKSTEPTVSKGPSLLPKTTASKPPSKVYAPKTLTGSIDKGKGIAMEPSQGKSQQPGVAAKPEVSFMRDARKVSNKIEKETDLREILDAKRQEKARSNSVETKETPETSGLNVESHKLLLNTVKLPGDPVPPSKDLIELEEPSTRGEIVAIEGITIDLPLVPFLPVSPSLKQLDELIDHHPHEHNRRRSDGDKVAEAMMAELIPTNDLQTLCGFPAEGNETEGDPLQEIDAPLIPTKELEKLCQPKEQKEEAGGPTGPVTRNRKIKDIPKGPVSNRLK